MGSKYQVPADSVSTEQVIKNSRFICLAGHCATPEEAMEQFKDIRLLHPKANHVCWAYIAGPPDTALRGMSDDGEPRGTAGQPMLSILEYSGLGEIWTAVVRYFGGVKLGTGGLVRAYGASVKSALADLKTMDREITLSFRITIDYYLLNSCETILAREGVTIAGRQFTEQVALDLLVPEAKTERIGEQLNQACNQVIHLESLGK